MNVQTTGFSVWFKQSKVVGVDKQPLIVYHGTSNDFSLFQTDPLKAKSYYGMGVSAIGSCFSESLEVASSYPKQLNLENRHVKEVYLSIQNPKKYTTLAAVTKHLILYCEERGLSLNQDRLLHVSMFKDYLMEQGYDGITYKEGPVYNPKQNKATVWVAFLPSQIRIIQQKQ